MEIPGDISVRNYTPYYISNIKALIISYDNSDIPLDYVEKCFFCETYESGGLTHEWGWYHNQYSKENLSSYDLEHKKKLIQKFKDKDYVVRPFLAKATSDYDIGIMVMHSEKILIRILDYNMYEF